MRDSQKSKLYAWENRECDALRYDHKHECVPTMEISEIKKLVTRVARDYGLSHRKVRVKDGRGRRAACYSANERAIKLPRWARREVVVLHELAHWLVQVMLYRQASIASHGKEFTGIFMELLRRYHSLDLSVMMQAANKVKLDFIPNSQCTARHLKKHSPYL